MMYYCKGEIILREKCRFAFRDIKTIVKIINDKFLFTPKWNPALFTSYNFDLLKKKQKIFEF